MTLHVLFVALDACSGCTHGIGLSKALMLFAHTVVTEISPAVA